MISELREAGGPIDTIDNDAEKNDEENSELLLDTIAHVNIYADTYVSKYTCCTHVGT